MHQKNKQTTAQILVEQTVSLSASALYEPKVSVSESGVDSSWGCGTLTLQWETSWALWLPATGSPPTGACPSSYQGSSSSSWAWFAFSFSLSVSTASSCFSDECYKEFLVFLSAHIHCSKNACYQMKWMHLDSVSWGRLLPVIVFSVRWLFEEWTL